MSRRIVLLFSVGAALALMVALSGMASATHAGDCTFAGGRTTCTVVVGQSFETVTETTTTTQSCQVGQSHREGQQEVTTTETYLVTTTTFQETVFRGRSENVESQRTFTTTSRELIDTETSEGQCRNEPGPQQGPGQGPQA